MRKKEEWLVSARFASASVKNSLRMGILLSILIASAFILFRGSIKNNIVEIEYGNPLIAEHSVVTFRSNKSLAGVNAPTPGPSAYLQTTFHDFGRLTSNQKTSITFLLRNLGKSPLTIQNAHTTCTCALAEFSTQSISPGKAALITIHFDPEKTHLSTGVIRRGVMFETNDPLQPWIEIWVQARLNTAGAGK